MKKNTKKNGFTLVEILIAMGIFVILVTLVMTLGKNSFFYSDFIEESFNVQEEVGKIIKPMSNEIRAASPSNTGAYPLENTSTSTIIFFSNIDDDILIERVRYFLSGSVLKKGVTKPSGSPLTYNIANESVSELVHNLVNDGTAPVFEYYGSTYTGTSEPLSQPVQPLNVRLVKINFVLDTNLIKAPLPLSVTTQVSIRNLKDNL